MTDASDVAAGNVSSAFAAANRGALTTIFTPPGTCLTETTLISYSTSLSSLSAAFLTTKVFINHFSWGDPACYPSTIATISGYTRWDNGYYNSPGICPSGWTSACEQTANAFGFSTTIDSDTSVAICCPSDWTCVGGATSFAAHGCSTDLFAGQTLTSVWPAAMPTPGTSMPLPDQRILTIWEITNNTSALCDAIPVMWQNIDVQILSLLGETTTAASTTAASTTIITTNAILRSRPSQTGTTSNSQITAPNNLGLSNDAKIGIGLAVSIVMLALLFGAFFYFRRRKKAENITHESHSEEINGDGLDCRHKPELPSEDTPLELDANRETMELESARVVHEMEDTSIPEMAMRDTSRILDPAPSNYITDIISKRFSAPDLNAWSRLDSNRENTTPISFASPSTSSRTSRRSPDLRIFPSLFVQNGSSVVLPTLVDTPNVVAGDSSSESGKTHSVPVNDHPPVLNVSPTNNTENLKYRRTSEPPSATLGSPGIISPVSSSPVMRLWSKYTTEAGRSTAMSNPEKFDVLSSVSDCSQRGLSTVFARDTENEAQHTSSQLRPPLPIRPPLPRPISPTSSSHSPA